mmetsp:Transcript_26976/g.64002  ORF Transcript_26976/g.64002 Transcript_26976/m.64002 type:complete len:291 (-) Transcript_26976:289-1161(-)
MGAFRTSIGGVEHPKFRGNSVFESIIQNSRVLRILENNLKNLPRLASYLVHSFTSRPLLEVDTRPNCLIVAEPLGRQDLVVAQLTPRLVPGIGQRLHFVEYPCFRDCPLSKRRVVVNPAVPRTLVPVKQERALPLTLSELVVRLALDLRLESVPAPTVVAEVIHENLLRFWGEMIPGREPDRREPVGVLVHRARPLDELLAGVLGLESGVLPRHLLRNRLLRLIVGFALVGVVGRALLLLALELPVAAVLRLRRDVPCELSGVAARGRSLHDALSGIGAVLFGHRCRGLR